MKIEKRSIPLCIILSLVTCGIYGLYWMYKLTEDTHQAVGRRTTASGGMAVLYSIITCSIYLFYWQYKMGESILAAKEQRGIAADKNIPIIYLVLSLFGLALVSDALLQSALNDVADADDSYTPETEPVQPVTPVLPEAAEPSDDVKSEETKDAAEDKKD